MVTGKDITPKVVRGKEITPKVVTGKEITPKVVTGKEITPKLLTGNEITPKVVTGKEITPKVLTGKELQENLKLNTRHKNTAWNTRKIKNIKANHELTLIRQKTQPTKQEMEHLKFLTAEEISNLHGFKI